MIPVFTYGGVEKRTSYIWPVLDCSSRGVDLGFAEYSIYLGCGVVLVTCLYVDAGAGLEIASGESPACPRSSLRSSRADRCCPGRVYIQSLLTLFWNPPSGPSSGSSDPAAPSRVACSVTWRRGCRSRGMSTNQRRDRPTLAHCVPVASCQQTAEVGENGKEVVLF